MIPFDEIDIRLEQLGQNRAWLSEASGRKPDSIRVALAPNAPSSKRSELLQKSLSDAIEKEESARKIPFKTAQNLVLEFEKEDFRNICQAAADGGQAPDEWAEGKLADLARMDVEAIAARLTPGNRKSS